ncbi:MAG: transaldolase / glucose-6-phosphate isomerase [Acidobacteriota bacterium]|jgi:transaldolase/glucose-6-phosphate isomerase|nr:transaldolase / glucose-6-phosphate isomerase [Acidobacteriota bacterium]
MSERGDLRLGSYTAAVEARLARWQEEAFGRRLWEKDYQLWSPEPIPELTDRLGWLDLPAAMTAEVQRLSRFSRDVAAEGFRDAVVLGMGGSSLAPEVYSRTFGPAFGHPAVTVLDSTHPDAVRALAQRLDPERSLFVVSSKSGTTTEMLSFFHYFWEQLDHLGKVPERGKHFVAVTDPGTPLQALARERGFREVFNAPEDVGGRYSALTPFGLVPAALLGVDTGKLLARGRAMAEACAGSVAAADNPGLRLGAALGELALAGRDKVTFVTSHSLETFPEWIEQLIAESTGKTILPDGERAGGERRGIVPVAGEPLGPPEAYGDDRFFAALLHQGDDVSAIERRLEALESAGHPVGRFKLSDRYDLGAEMFRWELATAAAGAVLEVNPFDQPDVQLAKTLANEAMKQAAAGTLHTGGGAVDASDAKALKRAVGGWVKGAKKGDYLGIHAYLPPRPETTTALRNLQAELHGKTRLAVTLGYGPRFLHSTGQLHKGGADRCRFLQIIDQPTEDLSVPETSYTFGTLIGAQAEGDRQALEQRGRTVLRVQLGTNDAQGLAALRSAVEEG